MFQLVPDDPALRMENSETRTENLGKAEQIELVTEPAMVATLGLGLSHQVGVQSRLILPGGAVDALHGSIFLIAPPVGGR